MGERVNPVQLQRYLKGVDYPASKDDIVRTARKQGADENVVSTLQALPTDRFNSPSDVSEAVGKLRR